MPPALIIRLADVIRDPALPERGQRKHIVTRLHPQNEQLADAVDWVHVDPARQCPVQVMTDTESAVFNQRAMQTRHRHQRGTEIYIVIEGRMRVEVEGKEHELAAGDMIVVNPGAWHEVRRTGEFLCRVITVNCGGPDDRFE
jgi:quercetin dioxygenase-like cupin family protein